MAIDDDNGGEGLGGDGNNLFDTTIVTLKIILVQLDRYGSFGEDDKAGKDGKAVAVF